MADPPWLFKLRSPKGITKKSAQGHYRCLPLDTIKTLGPMLQAACAPNCLLFLWATNPMLPQAFELMSAWGFRYSTAGTWAKISANGKVQFGPGMRLAVANEPFLIGIRGTVPVPRKGVPGLIVAPRRAHSQKPDEAYAKAELMVAGNVPKLDLFTRQTRPGWTAYGDESTSFDDLANAA